MFLVRLITVAGSLMFDPPLDSIEQGVLQAFDAIVLRSANVDEITTKVSTQNHSVLCWGCHGPCQLALLPHFAARPSCAVHSIFCTFHLGVLQRCIFPSLYVL